MIFRKLRKSATEISFARKWLLRYLKNRGKTSVLNTSGEKIIIVGNGPSTGEFEFEEFAKLGYNFVCVNFFALDEEKFFSIKPKYYCVSDNAFYDRSRQEKSGETDGFNRLVEILEKVDWEMTFVLAANKEPFFNNRRIAIQKLNLNNYDGSIDWLTLKLYDKNIACFSNILNVVSSALFFCLSGNATEIGLIGAENNIIHQLRVTENNDVLVEREHFYGTSTLNLIERGKVKKGELYKYMQMCSDTFRNYYKLASYAKMKGIPVYNLCMNSLIDVFEKKHDSDLLRK